VVELDVFAGGNMPLLQGSKTAGDFAEGVQLFGGEQTTRDLDAQHLHVGLSLSVYTVMKPE